MKDHWPRQVLCTDRAPALDSALQPAPRDEFVQTRLVGDDLLRILMKKKAASSDVGSCFAERDLLFDAFPQGSARPVPLNPMR